VAHNRIVVDTNVFIAAVIGNYNYPYKIFAELISTGEFQICLSDALLEEYQGVIRREKFRKYPGFLEKAEKLLDSLEEISIKINPSIRITEIEDDADNRLLELAVESQAFCIITGNTKDFNFSEFQSIKIYSPKEFYEFAKENF